MYFKNLIFFAFPPSMSFDSLPEGLAQIRLKPVGPMEMSSVGSISPFGRGDDETVLDHKVGNATWIAVGSETKILPPAVVNDLLNKKIAAIEEKEGRKLGTRARKRLKEDLVAGLLPNAMVKPGRVDAIIDHANHVIAIDTSSRKVAESVVSHLRAALGSFPALPINAEVAPRSVLTGWISGEPLPEGLQLGDACELRDPIDSGSTVRCSNFELRSEEIERHLAAGRQATRLALTFKDRLSFVLGEDLVVRKLKFLDAALSDLDGNDRDDLRAELDARFALCSGEVAALFAVLQSALHLSKAQ